MRVALAGHKMMGERHDVIVTTAERVFALVPAAQGKTAVTRALLSAATGSPPDPGFAPAEPTGRGGNSRHADRHARRRTNQMQAGRLRPMHPALAVQLLASPIVVHQLTRPLAKPLTDLETSDPQFLDEIVHAWLRATAPKPDPDIAVRA